MIRIKVVWDAYNQDFRFVDQNSTARFDDGEVYLFTVDFFPPDLGDEAFTGLPPTEMGHA